MVPPRCAPRAAQAESAIFRTAAVAPRRDSLSGPPESSIIYVTLITQATKGSGSTKQRALSQTRALYPKVSRKRGKFSLLRHIIWFYCGLRSWADAEPLPLLLKLLIAPLLLIIFVQIIIIDNQNFQYTSKSLYFYVQFPKQNIAHNIQMCIEDNNK